MVIIRESNASNLMNEEDEEEPGEVIESAPPLKVGEERTLGSSGIKKKLLKRGSGFELPDFGDEVTIKFVGCLLDGTRFAEADDRNYKVGSGEMVSGLDRGIVTMKKGEKALFTLPPELAYGEAGTNGVPPNSCIKFQVELISWIPVIDVSKDGGVIKRVVVKGEQTGKPCDMDQVLVKYVVTLADGTLLARTPEEGVEFYLNDGHLCPALPKAIKTMNRGEMVNLEVQPKYMSQRSGKGGLPPFMVKNRTTSRVAIKPAAQPQALIEVPKNLLSEHEVAERDEQIIQARIQDTAVEKTPKRHKKDGPSQQAPKASVTATFTQHLFGTLGSKYAGEAEPSGWWKADPDENAAAITKCLAEAFIRQAAHAKSFSKLSASNHQLDKQVKILQFQKEEDKRSLEKTYKSDLQAKEDELKKSAAEIEKLTNELKETKEVKEKMEADVARLNNELKIAKAETAAAVEESLAKGPVEFMKEFIRKIPDFDWERLGPGNAEFAESLRVEIALEDAEVAEGANAANPDVTNPMNPDGVAA